jgi:hypothetical protein
MEPPWPTRVRPAKVERERSKQDSGRQRKIDAWHDGAASPVCNACAIDVQIVPDTTFSAIRVQLSPSFTVIMWIRPPLPTPTFLLRISELAKSIPSNTVHLSQDHPYYPAICLTHRGR